MRAVFFAACMFASAIAAFAHQPGHQHHGAAAKADPGQEIKLSDVAVSIPALSMTREDGAQVGMQDQFDTDEPVFVNFIYTSCTTVCPVLSEAFVEVAEQLLKAKRPARLMSVSIDPEVDTPERLKAYAAQFGAPSAWHLFTGSVSDSTRMQKAFGIDIRDKMSHPIASFFRPARQADWVRIDGFATPEDLLRLMPASHRHQAHSHH